MTNNSSALVLAVDLDNTLIKTDMIYIGLKYLISNKIHLSPKLIWIFLTKGRTYAKKYLFDVTNFSVKDIPFNKEVINFIQRNRNKYTKTILISGSYHEYVNMIANHINLFDKAVGTSLDTNMVGINKVKFLKNKYKNLIFDYIGDSRKDIPIWESARNAYVVDNGNIIQYLKGIDYKIIR